MTEGHVRATVIRIQDGASKNIRVECAYRLADLKHLLLGHRNKALVLQLGHLLAYVGTNAWEPRVDGTRDVLGRLSDRHRMVAR